MSINSGQLGLQGDDLLRDVVSSALKFRDIGSSSSPKTASLLVRIVPRVSKAASLLVWVVSRASEAGPIRVVVLCHSESEQ